MKKITLALSFALLTGCGSTFRPLYAPDGDLTITGDAKGWKTFNDTMSALVTNGKASPDQDTAAWRSRREEEVEVTKRHMKPGLLDSLLAPSAPTGLTN